MKVKQLLARMGQVQSALLFGLFYLILWVPAGLVSRLAADWLCRRRPARTAWWRRSIRVNDPAHLREPF